MVRISGAFFSFIVLVSFFSSPMRLARSMTESVVGGTVAAVFQRVTFGVPLIPPLSGSKVLSNAVLRRLLVCSQPLDLFQSLYS